MSISTILVVGGTGKLGAPVARRLRADGHSVRVFTHNPDKAKKLFGAGYDILTGDVDNVATIERALVGCAGLHINLFGGSDPDLERRGAENLSAAAARAGLRRITYLSGATVSEQNAWFAGTKAKLGAEAAIRASGVPFTIFRAASFMESLPQYVRGTSASLIGSASQAWHWLAAEDYARMVSRAFEIREAEGKTLYVHGPASITTREALTIYCKSAHPTVAIRTMPMWLGQTVATLFRVKDLAEALPYLRYLDKVNEAGDPSEANELLGAPKTDLETWSQLQRQSAGRLAVKATA